MAAEKTQQQARARAKTGKGARSKEVKLPELPEVAAIITRLVSVIVGQHFVDLELRTKQAATLLHGDLTSLRYDSRLRDISRRGKICLFHFDSSATIVFQLGMSGRLLLREPSGPHDHIVLRLSGGGPPLTYADHRRFGAVHVWPAAEVFLRPPLFGIGPDALDSGLDLARFPSGSRAVKDVLLDQRVVAGIGNIYACEVLFRSGIDPRRPCSGLGKDERRRLATEIHALLTEAVDDRGATLADYRGTEGEAGDFDAKFAVYGREGLRCPGCNCGGSVVRIRQSGRSTWFCETKQI